MNDTEIANPEYIHEVVAKFVDDFINRRIFFKEEIHNYNDPKYITTCYAEFGDLIRINYFDTKIIGKDRAQLEKNIFNYIVAFTTFNLVIPSKFNSVLTTEKRLDKIEQKLDSTNKLLMSILAILQKIMKDDDET